MSRIPWVSVLLFAIGCIAVDRGVGLVLRETYSGIEGGAEGRINYALSRSDMDCFLFGSSRAVNHLDPEIFRERLGLATLNVGAGGQGVEYARLLQALLLARGSAAKLFVLQLDAGDLRRADSARARVFTPYYGEVEALDEIFEEKGLRMRAKLLSWLYRMSSWGLAPLRYLFFTGADPGDGFFALPSGAQNLEFGMRTASRPEPLEPGKLRRLQEFAAAGRGAGVEVVFLSVPRFAESPIGQAEAFAWVRDLAERESAWFLELHGDPRFAAAELYRDRLHLNGEAARELSRIVAERIAERFGGRWGPAGRRGS